MRNIKHSISQIPYLMNTKITHYVDMKDLNVFYSSNVGIFGESIYPIFWDGPQD